MAFIISLFCLSAFSTVKVSAQINYYSNWATTTVGYSFPHARSAGFAYTDHREVYYTNDDGYLCNLYEVNSIWYSNVITSAVKPLAYSRMVYTNKIYYVTENHKLYNLYFDFVSFSWKNEQLNVSAPDARGDAIVLSPDGNQIFYTNTAGNVISMYFSSNVWNLSIPPSTFPKAANESRMGFNNGNLFYVGTDGTIRKIYFDYGAWAWQCVVINSSAPNSRADGLIEKDGIIYYPNADNIFTKMDETTGAFEVMGHTTKSLYGYDYVVNNQQLYYFGDDNKVHTAYFENCTFYDKAVSNLNFNYGAMTYGDGRLELINNNGEIMTMQPTMTGSGVGGGFIYLKGKKFMSETNTEFYPMAVNYHIGMFTKDNIANSLYVGPSKQNSEPNGACTVDPNQELLAIDADFQKIHDLGFNTIRLVGAELSPNTNLSDNLQCNTTDFSSSYTYNPHPTTAMGYGGMAINMDMNFTNNVWLPVIDKVVQLAKAHNLKIIFLTGHYCLQAQLPGHNIRENYRQFLERVAFKFKNEPTIMAYDLVNEPMTTCGWNGVTESKDELCSVVASWYDAIRNMSPHQLVTISTYRDDMMKFDPEQLKTDFWSYHVYPFSNDLNVVAAELNYFAKFMKKPWILGETGFSGAYSTAQQWNWTPPAGWVPAFGPNPTDNASTQNEIDQAAYAQFSLNAAKASGASGYAWWAYADDGSYFGLVTQGNACNGPKFNHQDKLWLQSKFQSFNPASVSCGLTVPDKYFTNQFNIAANPAWPNFVSGFVKWNSTPVSGAIVKQGNNWTVTRDDGSFKIETNGSTVHDITAFAYGYYVTGLTSINLANGGSINISLNKLSGCMSYASPEGAEDTTSSFKSSIDDIRNLQNNISIFPNPTYSEVSVVLPESKSQMNIEVVNSTGQVMNKLTVNPGTTTVNVNMSAYANGVYFFKIQGDKETAVQPVVKK